MKKYLILVVILVLIGFGISHADMRSDASKVLKFGEVLLNIEDQASTTFSRMDNLKIKLNNLENQAEIRFGVGSPEVTEVRTVKNNIKAQYTNKATAW